MLPLVGQVASVTACFFGEAAAAVELDVVQVKGESLNNIAALIPPPPLVISAAVLIIGRSIAFERAASAADGAATGAAAGG